MESQMNGPEYFECKCGSAEHMLRFWFDDDPEFPCVYASVFLDEQPWHRRLWLGLQYILGRKCRYGHFAEFILRPEDRDRLVKVIKRLKVKK
jgi:hypothetical protein